MNTLRLLPLLLAALIALPCHAAPKERKPSQKDKKNAPQQPAQPAPGNPRQPFNPQTILTPEEFQKFAAAREKAIKDPAVTKAAVARVKAEEALAKAQEEGRKLPQGSEERTAAAKKVHTELVPALAKATKAEFEAIKTSAIKKDPTMKPIFEKLENAVKAQARGGKPAPEKPEETK